MRLTLNLPDGLLEEVMALSACDSKTETIVAALRAQAAALRQARLRALRGQSALIRASSPARPSEPPHA
jgi:hypothetical protein